jgi:phenylalanyl-tRNA synthetase alpha chain
MEDCLMNEQPAAREFLAKIERLQTDAEGALAQITDEEALAEWKRRYLGRHGAVTQLLRSVSSQPPGLRPGAGRGANQLRRQLEAAWSERTERVKQLALQSRLRAAPLDVTLPGRVQSVGRLHPITQVLRQLVEAFREMGFQVMIGPEVETDEFNFTMLNIPPHHPARDMHATFFVDPGASRLPETVNWVLRTHTSPNQLRVMQRLKPPIRVVVPGACYRHDNPDPSHGWMFYQMEGFAIGRGIALPDLKGAITGMVRHLFGPTTQVRFRGSYFPFTEPSVEVDLQCTLCAGRGCRLCSDKGWLEIIPGGIIHPQVLRNGGIDPARYSGFAFGAGPDRIAALKYGIEDIRILYQNDLRFLEQF